MDAVLETWNKYQVSSARFNWHGLVVG